jgi:probable HAF family extracellular repeat protein
LLWEKQLMERRTHATRALCSLLGSMLPLAGAVGQTYSVIDFATLGPAPISVAATVAAINAHGVSAGTDAVSRNTAFFSDGMTIFFIPSLRMDDQNRANGINASGLVTGWSNSGMPGATTPSHAYVYNTATGSLTDLGTPAGATDSAGNAINLSGQVTGYATVSSFEHAFLYSAGKMIDLGTLPGGTSSHGNAINDTGLVVGGADTANADMHAFITQGSSLTDLGTLAGGTSGTGYTSEAFAVNNAGQVVGSSSVLPSGSHAFLYSGGTMTDLGTLGGPNSAANGLNSSGEVVGSSGTSADTNSGFLYAHGVMTDLNALIDPQDPLIGKVLILGGVGINDSGWIVANGLDPTITAFMLVPLRYSPRSLAFSTQGVGTTGIPQPVTLTNTGTGPFALTMIATTSGFSQTNDCPAVLPMGASCTIQVASSPVTPGYQSGALNITSGSATLAVKLNGAAPPGTVSVVVKASATTVTAGTPVTVTWTSTSSATCLASGGAAGDGWAGDVSTNGTKAIIESAAGQYTYQLSCSLGGSQGHASVMVVDKSAPPGTGGGGGGGGGALDLMSLLALSGALARTAVRGRLRAAGLIQLCRCALR